MSARASLIANNAFTLALFTGLYPALFFISNNWFVLGISQSFYLLLVLTLAAFIPISLFYYALSCIILPKLQKKYGTSTQSAKLLKAIVSALVVFLACYILLGYLDFTLQELETNSNSISLRTTVRAMIGVFLVVYLIGVWKSSFPFVNLVRPLNIFIFILSLLAVGNLIFSFITSYEKIIKSTGYDDKKTGEVYADVKFSSKPNIYLIVPDSYPSNPLLKQFFNFDNHKFSNDLERLGFRIYDHYFSAYPYSLESMHSMFSMEHNYFRKSVGKDAVNLREVIAGRGNSVIDILRYNDYESIYLHETDYLLKEDCFIEKCMPHLSQYDRLRQNLKKFYFFDSALPESEYDVGSEMKYQIGKTKKGNLRFVYKHFMDAHSEVKSYDRQYSGRLAGFRKHYPIKIRQANTVLRKEVEQILEQDPTAMIVIVADHGTWAGAERTNAGLTRYEILDKFNVFLAIRWGPSYNGEYDRDIKTSVNLFRYIFAFLSDSQSILDTKVADDSYLRHNGVWKVVQDGEVMEAPQKINNG